MPAPADVVVSVDDSQVIADKDGRTSPLTTWTRNGVSVSYHPAANTVLRARQEAAVLSTLKEREQA